MPLPLVSLGNIGQNSLATCWYISASLSNDGYAKSSSCLSLSSWLLRKRCDAENYEFEHAVNFWHILCKIVCAGLSRLNPAQNLNSTGLLCLSTKLCSEILRKNGKVYRHGRYDDTIVAAHVIDDRFQEPICCTKSLLVILLHYSQKSNGRCPENANRKLPTTHSPKNKLHPYPTTRRISLLSP